MRAIVKLDSSVSLGAPEVIAKIHNCAYMNTSKECFENSDAAIADLNKHKGEVLADHEAREMMYCDVSHLTKLKFLFKIHRLKV